jgi:hypothetical protein
MYVNDSLEDKKDLWEELTIFNFALWEPWYVIGDFNDTLSKTKRSNGFLNHARARNL